MKLAIDAMGGDHAPEVIVKGAVKAIEQFSDIELILVGHEDENKTAFTKARTNYDYTYG